MYDRLFSRLRYFDGDGWSADAMDQAEIIEKACGGEYGNTLKKVVKSRSLKGMGYVNPPKGKAKDILAMEVAKFELVIRKFDSLPHISDCLNLIFLIILKNEQNAN
jgi:hypothetical protein